MKELEESLGNIERKIAVCTLSGGLDSAVAAAMISDLGFTMKFIFFDWGQKTYSKELASARKLSKYFNGELMVAEIPILKDIPGISLTAKETLTTALNEYVPNRNAILETSAVAYAESVKAGIVCVGSMGSDSICPDNSPLFIEAMQNLINQGTVLKPSIKIVAPLIKYTKADAVSIGLKLNVPFKDTWSCHNSVTKACGKCSNCISRLDAFEKNNSQDPIDYHT